MGEQQEKVYPDGGKYVGGIVNGKRHGHGTYTFPSGQKYVGEWKDGKRHGQVTFIDTSGFVYVGEFINNKPLGGWLFNTNGIRSRYAEDFEVDYGNTIEKDEENEEVEEQEEIYPDGKPSIATDYSGLTVGYVYALYNETIPNYVKIGMTTRDVNERAKELSNTGVPGEWKVHFSVFVPNCEKVEQLLHKDLDKVRYSSDREFFNIPLEEAERIVARRAQENIALYPGWPDPESVKNHLDGIKPEKKKTDEEIRLQLYSELEKARELYEKEEVRVIEKLKKAKKEFADYEKQREKRYENEVKAYNKQNLITKFIKSFHPDSYPARYPSNDIKGNTSAECIYDLERSHGERNKYYGLVKEMELNYKRKG